MAGMGTGGQRCVYVDFLNTGPAVAKTLRTQIGRADNLRRAGELTITSVVVDGGKVVGAVGLNMETGQLILSDFGKGGHPGGGRPHAPLSPEQCLGQYGRRRWRPGIAGRADLVDMEFVQFFPIGHLAPRMVDHGPGARGGPFSGTS